MRRSKGLLAAVSLAVTAGLAPAAYGQSDSATDAYQENPPTVGGGPGGGGSSGSSGTGSAETSGTAGSGAAGIGVPGTDSGSASGNLSEAEAARLSGGTPEGQLPATGFDRAIGMALVGTALLVSGVGLLRVARAPE
jgi:hypothetical protein